MVWIPRWNNPKRKEDNENVVRRALLTGGFAAGASGLLTRKALADTPYPSFAYPLSSLPSMPAATFEWRSPAPRKTRVLYRGRFFAYPIELSLDTISKLGPQGLQDPGDSFIFPPSPSRKDPGNFFLNRFGRELYETFFKSYTEKVWGTACRNMSAEWGAQRVKGLSIMKAVAHAVKKIAHIDALSGKNVETSLIEQCLYPTYGPGQMWERVANIIREQGGDIRMGMRAIQFSARETVSPKSSWACRHTVHRAGRAFLFLAREECHAPSSGWGKHYLREHLRWPRGNRRHISASQTTASVSTDGTSTSFMTLDSIAATSLPRGCDDWDDQMRCRWVRFNCADVGSGRHYP
jgi:hypothetical protein